METKQTTGTGIIGRIGSAITSVYNVLAGEYLVVVDGYESQGDGSIKVAEKYLKYDSSTEKNDFVDDPSKATYFDYILGGIILKKLKDTYPDINVLSFSLVSSIDIALKNYIQTGWTTQNATNNMSGGAAASKEKQNIRLTDKGKKYLLVNRLNPMKKNNLDIIFLRIIRDGKWHSTKELKQLSLDDFDELISSAHASGLIEMK